MWAGAQKLKPHQIDSSINEVAHILIEVAIFLGSFNIFIDVPTCINHLHINEML
jgi:hypothetical protein